MLSVGKSTISMAVFNSYGYVVNYQRVYFTMKQLDATMKNHEKSGCTKQIGIQHCMSVEPSK